MKVVSAIVKPLPHPFYGDSWVRGKDPWHVDAFPEEFKEQAPSKGKRKMGWFLQDAFGNDIGFVPDGAKVNEESAKVLVLVKETK